MYRELLAEDDTDDRLEVSFHENTLVNNVRSAGRRNAFEVGFFIGHHAVGNTTNS